jgi:hypothetical protein
VKDILQAYLKRLTNLSGNNRSLLLQRLIVDQFIDLNELAYIDGKSGWRIMDEVISRKSTVKLAPLADPRDENSNQKAKRLKRLAKKAEFIFEESGAKDLYIGWPFVTGKFNDDTIVRAPLCFFPVSLEIEKNHWVLKPKNEVNIGFNKSLLLAFIHFNEILIPEEILEFSFDDYERDSTRFRNLLYETLSESAIQLRFSRTFYADELTDFEPTTRKELESYKTGQLNVTGEAVLGIFPQADSYLVPDYEQMIEEDRWTDLDAFFTDKSLNAQTADGAVDLSHYFLTMVKEEESFTPLAMDSYQENALNAVKRGNSVVVQGPPGTGKSQLIGNLVSDFIARGKKVLVVSQKRAALDVVYERLKGLELEDFLALVHDFKSDRAAVYEKMASQIDRLQDYSRSNANLDAIQLDRAFRKASHLIEDTIDELDEYKEALFSETECGLSPKELYLTSNPDLASLNLTQEYLSFDFRELDTFLRLLNLFIDYGQQLAAQDHPWKERVNFAKFGMQDLQHINVVLDEIPKEANKLMFGLKAVVKEDVSYNDCRTISENLDKLKDLIGFLQTEEVYDAFKVMVPFGNQETELLWLNNSRNLINGCFDGEGVEESVPANEIGQIQVILKQRLDAKNTFWRSIRWNFSKEKTRLARVLVANGLRDTKKDLERLTEKLDNRLNLQHQLTKLRSVSWINDAPRTTNEEEINLWMNGLVLAVEAKIRYASFANFNEYFNLNQLSLQDFKEVLNSIYEVLKGLPDKRKGWNKYVLPRQIDMLLADDVYQKELKRSVNQDFDLICELDSIKDRCNEAEKAVLNKIDEHLDMGKEEILSLFDNSLRLAWLNHLESKHPILRSVSTLKFDNTVTDLQEAIALKQEASQQILLQRVREKTYEGIEFNRLNNRVTYRDLEHQVNKKRRIWPLRRLLSNFGEEIFKLMPCWLASPETVSTLFPMENIFDLVIFDEASQCFAEKGLPAIYRGRQVVIAGDDQQLQPFDLYRVRWEDEKEEVALEVDSLLSLAKNHLMQIKLKGHYRSQSYELIEFSNQHFYNGQLKMLPAFARINDKEHAIEYKQVDGIWKDQKNEMEAQAVIDLIKDEIKSKKPRSIGVVTFNANQQYLISDMIDDQLTKVPNDLFVKNIENVQGDERDLIIFSVAYAPDEKGKFNIQFGSLSQAGGENRLNVAVSRAKEKVIVVTSITPEQLKVGRTKNQGPKLLQAYLSFAKRVSEGTFVPEKPDDLDHDKAWYLKHKLRQWEKELPIKFQDEYIYADMLMKKGNHYVAALLTDDNGFYQSLSNKDTFAYQPALLEAKGWPFRMIHSRTYWIHKEKMKDRLMTFAELVIN